MHQASSSPPACPHAVMGDSKTAAVARAHHGRTSDRTVTDFENARRVLRDPEARQAGFLAEIATRSGLMRPPILFLQGEAHRRQRLATARFFTPRAVATRYQDLMVKHSDRLIARLVASGAASLDKMAFELAVVVAAEIVGLTESDPTQMAPRLETLTSFAIPKAALLSRLAFLLRSQFKLLRFFLRDVKPAIRVRRKQRRDDVISHLIDEDYTDREILSECLVYAIAGMVTTRELIAIAGWHLLERPALRERFLAADDAARIALLEEILRLEPVVGRLYRRAGTSDGRNGELVQIDIRGANTDVAAAGACPHNLDPDRTVTTKSSAALMAFGDGEHRCPGAYVAMQESAIFLDKLLRTPGLKLVGQPELQWNPVIEGYEVRNTTIVCDAKLG